MKPPNTSHDPEQSPLPPDIVDALADALATALVADLQQGEVESVGQAQRPPDSAKQAE